MRAALLSIVCVSASQTCGGTGGESGVEAGLINAQYLVKGAGASAMAFVDTLLSESPTASIALVDTEPRPGGHWIHAYDFVRLHQSASFYGVASRRLEPTEGDFAHLSSKHEILARGGRARQGSPRRRRTFGWARVAATPRRRRGENPGRSHVA